MKTGNYAFFLLQLLLFFNYSYFRNKIFNLTLSTMCHEIREREKKNCGLQTKLHKFQVTLHCWFTLCWLFSRALVFMLKYHTSCRPLWI